MRLQLNELRAEPGRAFPVQGTVELGEVQWEDELLRLEGPVSVEGSAFYQQGRLFVELSVAGTAHRRCARCLNGLTEPFRRKDFLEVPLEDPKAPYVELAPLVEAGIRLAVTGRPLCREDCRGICPRCGADLNRGPHEPGCQAGQKEVDPRLEKLRDIL